MEDLRHVCRTHAILPELVGLFKVPYRTSFGSLWIRVSRTCMLTALSPGYCCNQ
ncbi:hypothetical protein CPB85DRAFT_1329730 [Mucidula mucida]|nr:hypothetical protein CPB85DRAFT_1331495 [Mucidula mucida]KAF8895076.1 hypothetical protein CPB85DRAFT_1329730 [Mucidula mucida]